MEGFGDKEIMPYISKEEREILAPITDVIFRNYKLISRKGRLNYLICMLAMARLFELQLVNYDNVSEMVDAVHDAEAELRRRLLDKYEDLAILRNGDVFHPLILKKIFEGKKK